MCNKIWVAMLFLGTVWISSTYAAEGTPPSPEAAKNSGELTVDKNAIRPFHVECSGKGTHRIAQAHQCDKVA